MLINKDSIFINYYLPKFCINDLGYICKLLTSNTRCYTKKVVNIIFDGYRHSTNFWAKALI